MEEKTYSDGSFTRARFISFVKSALRGARWGPKYAAKNKAFVKSELNPKSGKMRKLYACAKCSGLFPSQEVESDHIIPVVGEEGFVDWNTYIEKLFVDTDQFRVLCKDCHSLITLQARYKLTEEQAIIQKQGIEFAKKKPTAQINILKSLGLDPAGATAKRRATYEKHLNESARI